MPLCNSILVTDDSDDTRELVVDILKNAGFIVEQATNGSEALKKLTDNNGSTLILLDLMMPVMDGWEFLKERGLENHKVVTISAVHSDTLDLQQWPGIAAVLHKPLFAEDILGIAESFCEKAKTAGLVE